MFVQFWKKRNSVVVFPVIAFELYFILKMINGYTIIHS